ncbi:hypothetical protein BLA60_19495 [Actinophytocola xinjiangensis]|uniref:Uncharacterized protein n=1 Tax=Actinophytocola xinjiangensis TaxID=485602 RepID=A0A7Z1AY81_9PSEU|nr:hypothetical protein [Actinophytocola xinjiangensis]OLF09362.1 hypothetical protein BLA60_19495 [Actinophytocola xinjiangensis]
MESISLASNSGEDSVLVRLGAADRVVLVAGIVEWRRTLVGGRTWVWRTPDGTAVHISTTGHAPECAGLSVAVLAGPVAWGGCLDVPVEPGVSEEVDDDVLYRWLGDEIANDWPFTVNTVAGVTS